MNGVLRQEAQVGYESSFHFQAAREAQHERVAHQLDTIHLYGWRETTAIDSGAIYAEQTMQRVGNAAFQ